MTGHFMSISSSDPSTLGSTSKMDESADYAASSSMSKSALEKTTLVSKASAVSDAKSSKSVICPFCYTRIKAAIGHPCPNESCYSNRRGIPLPEKVFTHELFPVVIVGAASSGKSHYLATLKHSLVHEAFWGAGDKKGGYWNWSFVTYCNPIEAAKKYSDFSAEI